MLEKLLRTTLQCLLKLFFRVKIKGLAHFLDAGEACVIICNHQSFLEPLLLAAFLPEKPAFAMNVHQAKKWYFRPLGKLVDIFPIDPTQSMSTKTLISRVRQGGKIVIFPEGRITITGGLMKIYDGTGMVIDRTQAIVLPVRVEGAQYSKLSRMHGKLRTRLFPKITLTFMPARHMQLPAHAQGKERRKHAAQWIYDTMVESAFNASDWKKPILRQVLDAALDHGFNHPIVEDINRQPQSYRKLFLRCFTLSRALKRAMGDAPHVGVMLPTSLASMITFLSLHILNRVPAMLNFSAGAKNIDLACQMAEANIILTSRAFIARGKMQPLIDSLNEKYRIIYLEDVRKTVNPLDKLMGVLSSFFPGIALFLPLQRTRFDDPAVVLYTSGSEGTPKGVVLSHANILANIQQVSARLDFTEHDIIFNALPMFHSFGLTVGTILPLALGIGTFLYPSPLHYRIVPELVYDSEATIMLGTDTFFRGYAAYAHPYDFHRIRLAVAGAEKLKTETSALYMDKFRVDILQGYGVTESSPVLSVNTPMEHRAGTVGRMLPGIRTKLEPVEGITQGGRLLVKGPNIMLGYIYSHAPGILQAHPDWYDTGDIVNFDADGYINILGRAKRFAKIGGEMVSLVTVEEFMAAHWPEFTHAAIAVNDDRKGEQIVLFTEAADIERTSLTAKARDYGLPEIALPRKIVQVQALPRLGSGKVDYVTLKEMAA